MAVVRRCRSRSQRFSARSVAMPIWILPFACTSSKTSAQCFSYSAALSHGSRISREYAPVLSAFSLEPPIFFVVDIYFYPFRPPHNAVSPRIAIKSVNPAFNCSLNIFWDAAYKKPSVSTRVAWSFATRAEDRDAERLSMRYIREVLRLHDIVGLPQRAPAL